MIEMIKGAMDELSVGDPWHLSTDVGPVIDEEARAGIAEYVAAARKDGRVLHELTVPERGTYVAPALIKVNGIKDMQREIFGPVLHVATFKGTQIEGVIEAINATGYGLTFGLHTRIDTRVQEVTDAIHAGNIYVNRNQIGAIVGSQPFGGEGLSGTGPKAGGPNYITRYQAPEAPSVAGEAWPDAADVSAINKRLGFAESDAAMSEVLMPGPTGELNRLALIPRKPLLCMGPGQAAQDAQLRSVQRLGGVAVTADGALTPEHLIELQGFSGVLWWGDAKAARAYETALARRDGPILPLIAAQPDLGHIVVERHLCVDTTAAGGNAALLAGEEG